MERRRKTKIKKFLPSEKRKKSPSKEKESVKEYGEELLPHPRDEFMN